MNEKSTNCRICNEEFTDKEHVNVHEQKKHVNFHEQKSVLFAMIHQLMKSIMKNMFMTKKNMCYL